MQLNGYLEDRTVWGWLSCLFAAQTVGALIVQRLFQMEFSEIIIPVCLLALGALVSLGFRWYSGGTKLGSWQRWIPVIVYAAFIFSLSSRSYPTATPCFSTKIFHPIEYAVLGLLLCVALIPVLLRKSASSFAVRVFSLGLLYGASDEFHQSFIPGRTPRVTDVFFWDLPGIALGLAAFLLIRQIWRSLAERPLSV